MTNPNNTSLRTVAKAGDVCRNYPDRHVVITLKDYKYSISFYQNEGKSYMVSVQEDVCLEFGEDKLYRKNNNVQTVISEAELQAMGTGESITDIDLPLLRTFYGIILTDYERTHKLRPVIYLYVPELVAQLGGKRNISQQNIVTIIRKTQQFHNIIGVLKNGNGVPSMYPVLNFEGYDSERNVISFRSPYFNHIITSVYQQAIRTDKKGKKLIKGNGDYLRSATHCYLIDKGIAKERNKAAVENVCIIVQVIETAGNHIPHIKATTLIERNTFFAQRLQVSKNPQTLLTRVFKRTWELLVSCTKLKDVYRDIELPDPSDVRYIPNKSTLDSMSFSFPHKGKTPKGS